jgi:Tol biopolymer transport system component
LTAYVGSEAEPAFSPDGKQIAFVWDGEQENNHDIYVKLLDVGHPLRLTTDPSRNRAPIWSPDGRFIAFLRHLPCGTDEAMAILVPSLGGPVADGGVDWSPDGKSLAVIERGPPGQSEGIFLLSVETGERRRITKPPGVFTDISREEDSPRFFPDGKRIAFASTRSGSPEIWVCASDGTNPIQLTYFNGPQTGCFTCRKTSRPAT